MRTGISRSRQVGTAALALGAVLTFSARGWAQEPPDRESEKQAAASEQDAPSAPVSKQARSQARKKFQTGASHLGKQQYDEAIAAFQEAYRLDPRPDYLYNLGVSYRLKGDAKAAYEHFQQYLAVAPDGRLVVAARRYADEQSRRLAQEAERENREQSLRAERERAEQLARELRERAEQAESAKQQTVQEAEAEVRKNRALMQTMKGERDRMEALVRSNRGSGKRMIGTSLVALGGLAAGAAVFAGLDARSANSALDGLGEGDEWSQSRAWLYERGEASNGRLLLLSITGAALIAGGATLYYLGDRESRKALRETLARRSTAASVAPAVLPGGAGVRVFGAF